MKSIVYIKLPKAGLGNKLVVWARGYVFAHNNHLSLFRSSWFYLNIGPWIRNEKKKRIYLHYFKNRDIKSFFIALIIPIIPNKFIERNPDRYDPSSKFKIYWFEWNDDVYGFFSNNILNRELIKEGILSQLTKNILIKIQALQHPLIGVHIRKGDWKFNSVFLQNSYYIDKILEIRKGIGNDTVQVIIFSDGKVDELTDILSLPNVTLSKNKEDILDIFELSNSRYCILSLGSTFSYWSGFFNQNQVIYHPKDEMNSRLSDTE
jgi:Glycosyl transferase family 11